MLLASLQAYYSSTDEVLERKIIEQCFGNVRWECTEVLGTRVEDIILQEVKNFFPLQMMANHKRRAYNAQR